MEFRIRLPLEFLLQEGKSKSQVEYLRHPVIFLDIPGSALSTLTVDRYAIPISVTWLLHAPKMSDGYLLFLGSEAPFVGSIFAVDLRRQMIYQQDPPTTAGAGPNQRPRRWVLPYNKFVERLPENPAMASKQSALLRYCTLFEVNKR